MNRWDKYFFDLCNVVGENSKCLSRKIGAVLTRDKRVISTGYNGPPVGIPHCNFRYFQDEYLKEKIKESNIKITDYTVCPRRNLGLKSGEGLDLCIAAHSERNCLISAARNGICTEGTVLYMNCPVPCKDCFIEIINAGVEEIVVSSLDYYDPTTKYLRENSNVRVRVFQL